MNEEFERKFERAMEFHLRQQAEFDANMAKLEVAQAETQRKLDRAAENISHLAGFIHEGFGLTMNLFKDTDEKFKETAARSQETDTKIRALAEEHKLTQEELRKLMGKVNRHLSDDHGLEN